MDQDERRAQVAWIAEDVLEVEHVYGARVEEVAAADRRVNVHREMQPAGLDDDVAKNEILECLVLRHRRHAAAVILLVDCPDRVTRWIVERQRAEVRGFELHCDTSALLAVLQRPRNEGEIFRERRRQRASTDLLRISLEQLCLERHVRRLVGVTGREPEVVERKHEAVDEEHPLEPRRIEVVGHGHAVRHRRLDADAIEDVIEILRAFELVLEGRLLIDQPFRVAAAQIRKRKPKQRPCCCDWLGVVLAHAQRRRAWRRRRRIDIRIIGERRVRMVIEDLDAFDLRQEAPVHCCGRRVDERARLRRGNGPRSGCGGDCRQNRQSHVRDSTRAQARRASGRWSG